MRELRRYDELVDRQAWIHPLLCPHSSRRAVPREDVHIESVLRQRVRGDQACSAGSDNAHRRVLYRHRSGELNTRKVYVGVVSSTGPTCDLGVKNDVEERQDELNRYKSASFVESIDLKPAMRGMRVRGRASGPFELQLSR